MTYRNTGGYRSAPGGYRTIPAGGNPRETEAWALTEAARRMADAKTRVHDGDDFLNAVRLNWRLWTIFQASLAEVDCPLPAEIRANMLSLSNFVDKTSVDILAEPQAQKVDILISINRNIAAGLFSATQPGGADAGLAVTDQNV
ncbi:MAG: flagellar biosynthesis regulator FlaF [Rhodospirillaceae bacterium]|nr:flagellar biosynthesis regulator FlaF [Rhodospirillales bacterium]